MNAMTPQNAIKLAAWLAVHQPSLFRLLQTQQEQGKLTPGAPRPLGRLGLGDDSFLQDVSFDPGSIDVSADTSAAIDAANFNFEPDLQTVGVDAATANIGDVTGGGFWSSIGDAASSVGSGVLAVAKGLVGALPAAAGAATAYFNNQAKTTQLQTQQAATQAQFALAAQGKSPAPITYQRNAAGQLVPVYASANGQYVPLNTSALQSLTSSTIGGLPTWAVLAGAVVILTLLVRRASS